MAYIDDPTTQKANLSFIKASMRTPLLSREREFELAQRWREGGDTVALHELVRAYARLVIAIAEGWNRGPTGTPPAEPEEVGDVVRRLLAGARPYTRMAETV